MTQFEKVYILKCLDSFAKILSDYQELALAIANFTETHSDMSRFYSNSSIPDSILWTTEDKLNFSAAFFEATAHANTQFLTAPELSMQVALAQRFWQDHYKPLLSSNTLSENRIATVLQNCIKIKAEVSRVIPSDAPQSFVQENPYTFFTALTALGVVAVGAAIIFKP